MELDGQVRAGLPDRGPGETRQEAWRQALGRAGRRRGWTARSAVDVAVARGAPGGRSGPSGHRRVWRRREEAPEGTQGRGDGRLGGDLRGVFLRQPFLPEGV